MSSEFREYAMSLLDVADEYAEIRVTFALKASRDVIVLVKRRAFSERLDARGQPFGIYKDSTWNAIVSGPGVQKKQRYGDKKNGDRRINFSRTNRFWTTVLEELERVTDKEIVVSVDTRAPEYQNMGGSGKNLTEVLEDQQDTIIIETNERENLILDSIYGGLINTFLNKRLPQ